MADFDQMVATTHGRRAFLSRLGILGVSLGVTSLVTVGCGNDDNNGSGGFNGNNGNGSGNGVIFADPTNFPGIRGRTIDEVVFNFALTLEFLEADLYRQALNLASGRATSAPLEATPASYALAVPDGGLGVKAHATDGNGTRSDDEIAAFLSFRPEQVESYEVGYKGSLMDGAVNVAIAGFYADYTDVQIPGSVACTVSGLPSFCGVVSNAGKATFKGVEFEGRVRLGEDLAAAGDRLTLSTALGYIDADYKEYVSNIGGVPTDVADFRQVQNTPKWTASGTIAYATPIGDGDLSFGTTLSYRSKTYQFEIPNPYIDQKGFAMLDASIVYTAPDDRWSIGLFGKNLTDKEYKTSGYTFINVNPTTGVPVIGANGLPTSALGTEGTLTAFYGNPRQVFVTGTVKF